MTVPIENLNMDYFNSAFRLEWESEILNRRGIIPTEIEPIEQPKISIEWEDWKEVDGKDVQNMTFTFKKDDDIDYAGRILIKCSELNSKAFIQGMNNFVVDVRWYFHFGWFLRIIGSRAGEKHIYQCSVLWCGSVWFDPGNTKYYRREIEFQVPSCCHYRPVKMN